MARVSEEIDSKSTFKSILLTVGNTAWNLLNLIRTRISAQQEDIKNIARKLSGHASELTEHHKHENCNQITKESCDVTSDNVSGRQFYDSLKLKSLKSHLYSGYAFPSLNSGICSDSMKYTTFQMVKHPCNLISNLVVNIFHLIQPPERYKKRTAHHGTSDNSWISLLIGLIVMLTFFQGASGTKVQEGKTFELRPNRSDARDWKWTFTPLSNTSVVKILCLSGDENRAEKITLCPGFSCISSRLQILNFQQCHEGSYDFHGAASCGGPECIFKENHSLTIDDADVANTSGSWEEANSSLSFPEQNSTTPVHHNPNNGGFNIVVVVCVLVAVILAMVAVVYKIKLWKFAKKTEDLNSAQCQKMLGNNNEQNGLV